jgi:hypothetical protein
MGRRQDDGDRVDWSAEARRVMDEKAKPPGSLGRLEDWAVRYILHHHVAVTTGGF